MYRGFLEVYTSRRFPKSEWTPLDTSGTPRGHLEDTSRGHLWAPLGHLGHFWTPLDTTWTPLDGLAFYLGRERPILAPLSHITACSPLARLACLLLIARLSLAHLTHFACRSLHWQPPLPPLLLTECIRLIGRLCVDSVRWRMATRGRFDPLPGRLGVTRSPPLASTATAPSGPTR